ncbi:MAG: hypothetical protein HYR84_11630 [Planctomycetes bacterium]|nr:hypothetical protein [Planctomycetota bacterium]
MNMPARCPGAWILLFLPVLLASAGCRNKTDVLEIELRTREHLYRDLLDDHKRSEARITALQMEVDALRKGGKITPEQAASTYGLKRIVLGRSTGGVDNDGVPGDEALQVVVEPRDYDDHSIKAPGVLQIIVMETTPQGVKTPLSAWDISGDALRQSWKQGLLSTGYTLTLPWKQFPVHEQLRVVVRFVTPDQRVFEADRDIKVRLVPGAGMKRMEAPKEMPMMPAPPAETGPALVPTGRTTPAPHTAQWRPVELDRPVTIGRPTPIP